MRFIRGLSYHVQSPNYLSNLLRRRQTPPLAAEKAWGEFEWNLRFAMSHLMPFTTIATFNATTKQLGMTLMHVDHLQIARRSILTAVTLYCTQRGHKAWDLEAHEQSIGALVAQEAGTITPAPDAESSFNQCVKFARHAYTSCQTIRDSLDADIWLSIQEHFRHLLTESLTSAEIYIGLSTYCAKELVGQLRPLPGKQWPCQC